MVVSLGAFALSYKKLQKLPMYKQYEMKPKEYQQVNLEWGKKKMNAITNPLRIALRILMESLITDGPLKRKFTETRNDRNQPRKSTP